MGTSIVLVVVSVMFCVASFFVVAASNKSLYVDFGVPKKELIGYRERIVNAVCVVLLSIGVVLINVLGEEFSKFEFWFNFSLVMFMVSEFLFIMYVFFNYANVVIDSMKKMGGE